MWNITAGSSRVGLVFTLGYSRALMAEAALEQKPGTLLRLHEEAFRQLGRGRSCTTT